MQPVIRLSNVTKTFGSQRALDGATLEVPPGVVCALLGENGAGKTTAIRILLGLAQPDSGQVEVLGLDSARAGQQVRSRVGYVAERPTLYDWMTVAEIGWFTAGFYGDGFLPRYAKLADDFHLPAQTKIRQMSKGTRAKVSLALALAHEPELLVLDEPTSGLDTLVRREFLEGMVDVAAAGRTVLLSSHQIAEVERVADLVAIIHAGRVLLVERLEDLKDQIREVTITLAEGAAGSNDALARELGGQILRARRSHQQLQLLVRGLGEDAAQQLRSQSWVRELGLRTPSLEEIYVAYLQADQHGGSAPSTAAEVSVR